MATSAHHKSVVILIGWLQLCAVNTLKSLFAIEVCLWHQEVGRTFYCITLLSSSRISSLISTLSLAYRIDVPDARSNTKA